MVNNFGIHHLIHLLMPMISHRKYLLARDKIIIIQNQVIFLRKEYYNYNLKNKYKID